MLILLLTGCVGQAAPTVVSGPIVPDPPTVHRRELPALDALEADFRQLIDRAKAP